MIYVKETIVYRCDICGVESEDSMKPVQVWVPTGLPDGVLTRALVRSDEDHHRCEKCYKGPTTIKVPTES